MAWTRLQSVSNSPGGGTTVSVTPTSNLTSGSTLIALGVCFGGTGSSVKDAAGNSFVKIASQLMNGTAADGDVSVWALNTPAGDAGTKPAITFTSTGSSAILLQEVSGLATGTTAAQLADGTAGVLGGETVHTGGTIGPPTYASTASNEYLFYVYGDTGQEVTFTVPGGYTPDPNNVNDSGNNDVGVAYKNSTGGTEAGAWTLGASGTGSAIDWGLILVAFKLAGGGTVTLPYPAQHRAVQAKIPPQRIGGFSNGYGTDLTQASGRVMWNSGAPVRNPVPGPVFRQRTTPVRFILPPPVPRAGRIGSSFGTILQAPSNGPPVYAQNGPARARILPGKLAGSISDGFSGPALPGALSGTGKGMGSGGAPLRNPIPGPSFRQRTSPAKAQNPLPKRGRISFNPGGPVRNPPPPGIGPLFRQATSPARIRPAAPPRGRTASNGGAPVKNPTQGPVFRQATYPVQFQMDRTGFPRGRAYFTRVTPSSQPAPPPAGPVFQQAVQAVRARLPRSPQAGSILDGSKGAAVPGPLNGAGFGGGIGSGGAPVKNPTPGPAFRQAVRAFRAQVALHPRAGRIAGISQGGPVNNPIPPAEYLFIGHYAVEYPDYVDVNTDEMLICIPNQMYLMAVVQNRYGLTIPPPDGRWLGETEQPDEAVLVNPAQQATIQMAMARKRNAELQARSARGERITLTEEKPDDRSG